MDSITTFVHGSICDELRSDGHARRGGKAKIWHNRKRARVQVFNNAKEIAKVAKVVSPADELHRRQAVCVS